MYKIMHEFSPQMSHITQTLPKAMNFSEKSTPFIQPETPTIRIVKDCQSE